MTTIPLLEVKALVLLYIWDIEVYRRVRAQGWIAQFTFPLGLGQVIEPLGLC